MQKRMLAIGSQLSSGEIDRFDLTMIHTSHHSRIQAKPIFLHIKYNALRVKARRSLTYSWIIMIE